MKVIVGMLVAAGAVGAGCGPVEGPEPETYTEPMRALGPEPAGGEAARQAFAQRASGRMLRVSGRVIRLLPDDRDGSPHQRFIIGTVSGQTLLVAHNLDLAPRLAGLAAGDSVTVYGEYEWNEQGGLMHWTHDDPGGSHAAGYIEWRGTRYQ